MVVVCSLLCWFILITEEVNDDDNYEEITVARDKYVKYTNGQWKTFARVFDMCVCVIFSLFCCSNHWLFIVTNKNVKKMIRNECILGMA